MSLLQVLKLPPPPAVTAAKSAGPAFKPEKLLQAAEAWRQARGQAAQRIAALKAAVKSQCADEAPPLRKEIDTGLAKLDAVLETVDHRLADSLTTAAVVSDDTARKAEFANAKAILAEYVDYLKGDPLVARIDSNPFGVKTGLQALLAAGLAKAAHAF